MANKLLNSNEQAVFDEFYGKAMQALISNPVHFADLSAQCKEKKLHRGEVITAIAYGIAEDMMSLREAHIEQARSGS